MIDRYTKVVLTIIAVALVGLLIRPWVEPPPARAAIECGTQSHPCWTLALAWVTSDTKYGLSDLFADKPIPPLVVRQVR